MTASLYIGLMSGTSADGIDAVLLDTGGTSLRVQHHVPVPYAADLQAAVRRLSLPGEDSLDLLGETDHRIGEAFAGAATELMNAAGLVPADIAAIGSHGQTVRHRPAGTPVRPAFTLQIGDPGLIAARTGITTVADFRRKDMALGGQGAPLVPAFHRAVFQHPSRNRVVVNIGGIANLTWLPAGNDPAAVTGFDTGPGNCLMDAWTRRHLDRPYDHDGNWAASGQTDPGLLTRLLAHEFLARPAPKSTGVETFHLDWLRDQDIEGLSAEDVQATLAAFTVRSIVRGLELLPSGAHVDDLFLCGGGSNNRFLVSRLRQAQPVPVQTTAAAGVEPEHVEGAAFAWLAYRTLNRLPGALASVTGASRDSVLGGIYYP